jgi:1,4-dihydroxy-2-naphthoyl-CoA hydrolase
VARIDTPRFEHFDSEVAERMLAAGELQTGLPGYLGVRFVEFEPGRLRAEMEAREELRTPFGNLHGAVIAGLVDHVLGCVLYPLMRRGQWAATTEFKLNYLAPITRGKILAESTVVSMTRSTAVVRVEVSNEGRLAAIAQGTLLIRDPK